MGRFSGTVIRVASLLGAALAVSTSLAACSASEVVPPPVAESATPADSPSTGPDEADAERSCRNAQAKVLRGLEWPLTQVVWRVTSDVDGASAEASRLVAHGLERGEAKLEEPCGGLPQEMAGMERTVLATTVGPLDAAGLERLERAVGGWARTLGTRAPLQGTAAWVRHCRELGTELRAGYTMGWSYTPRGRLWWVEMVIDSDLSKRVWVELSGTLWATGLPRDPYVRHDGRGGQQVAWGGSSADAMYADPLTRSTTKVGLPGPSGDLRTPLEGRVYGVHPEVYVRHGGPTCSLPVSRIG